MKLNKQIVDFINEEKEKRKVSGEMQAMLDEVFEKIFMKKAKLRSIETAIDAMTFSDIDTKILEEQKDELVEEIDRDTDKLSKCIENMITPNFKDDFVKVLKKTKFIHREPFDFRFFSNLRPETKRAIEEGINEELVKLLPYKVAELVKDEYKVPEINKFLTLYSVKLQSSEILMWIDKYAATKVEEQQILVHFDEIKNDGIYTDNMISEIAVRWAKMLGINVEKSTEENKKIIKEASELIRANANLII